MAAVPRLADRSDLPALGRVLGRAFETDPVWQWFVTHDSAFVDRVSTVMEAIASAHLTHGEIYTSGAHDGAAIWAPPGAWRTPPMPMLRRAPRLLSAVGRERLGRIRDLQPIEARHPSEPHWYLAMLGVEPNMTGQGIGTSLMAPVLERCDGNLMPAFLESSKEENIGLYERHGFEVTSTIDISHGGPRIWLMWRDPDPSRLGY